MKTMKKKRRPLTLETSNVATCSRSTPWHGTMQAAYDLVLYPMEL